MLERIIRTTSLKGVNLFLKEAYPEEDVFHVITESIVLFHEQFHDNKSYIKKSDFEDKELKKNGEKEYYRWAHKLIEKGKNNLILGFINLYQKNLKQYNIGFSIGDPSTNKFMQDVSLCMKYAGEYHKFVENDMKKDKRQPIHIINLKADVNIIVQLCHTYDNPSLEKEHKDLLLEKLNKIDQDIEFNEFIILGPGVMTTYGPEQVFHRWKSTTMQDIQYLFDFIENSSKEVLQHRLVEFLYYKTNAILHPKNFQIPLRYEDILSTLKKRLNTHNFIEDKVIQI